MGLLDTIRSLLGMDGDGERSGRGDRAERRTTDVRVEHDPDETTAVDTGSEAAVKGTDDSPEHDRGSEEPVAAETDAAASTGSLTETPDEPEAAAEPAEATGAPSGDPGEPDEPGAATGRDEPGEPGTATEATESDEAEEPEAAEEPEGAGEPAGTAGEESVRAITGIGQAYGKRLSDAGIETVADLVDADAADLADESGISERRIATWQQSARNRLD